MRTWYLQIALDEGRSEDISDMDVMTRGDSEESDEDDGSGDLTGKDAEGQALLIQQHPACLSPTQDLATSWP